MMNDEWKERKKEKEKAKNEKGKQVKSGRDNIKKNNSFFSSSNPT